MSESLELSLEHEISRFETRLIEEHMKESWHFYETHW